MGEAWLRNHEKTRGKVGGRVLTKRRSIWDWTCDFVGDPDSWAARGEKIVEFLRENGMTPESQVLEIGCGNLSQGKPLIEYLAPGHYHGIEPFGLLVEAALDHFPALESNAPRFSWADDFDGSEFGVAFDIVVAHSVLSHCAHWQLDQLLTNVRRVVRDDAVFLCSYRRGGSNTLASSWTYPDVTQFRLETVRVAGAHTGWRVEEVAEYKQRLSAVAPNDVHNWLRMQAIDSAAAMNDLRLLEEERLRTEEVAREEAETLRRFELEEADRRAALGDAE